MSDDLPETTTDSPITLEQSDSTPISSQISSYPRRRLSFGLIGGVCIFVLIGLTLLTFNTHKSTNKQIAVSSTATPIVTTTSTTIFETPEPNSTSVVAPSAATTSVAKSNTPTPVTFGNGNASATVTFTRSSQNVKTLQNTVTVASDNSGQVLGKTVTLSQNNIPGPAIFLPLVAGNPDFTLSATNHTTGAIDVLFGQKLVSVDASTFCLVEIQIVVPSGATSSVDCRHPNVLEVPVTSWDDSSSISGLEFTGQSPAYAAFSATIPNPCVSASVMDNAALPVLGNLMDNEYAQGSEMGRVYNIDNNSISCNPSAGSVVVNFATSIQYHTYVNGSVSGLFYSPQAVCNYQQQQLANQAPSGYILVSTSICGSLSPGKVNATATEDTVTCSLTGTVAYNWTNSMLQALTERLAGKDKGSAQAILNITNGVAAGSATISMSGNTLPQNANDIRIIVNG